MPIISILCTIYTFQNEWIKGIYSYTIDTCEFNYIICETQNSGRVLWFANENNDV